MSGEPVVGSGVLGVTQGLCGSHVAGGVFGDLGRRGPHLAGEIKSGCPKGVADVAITNLQWVQCFRDLAEQPDGTDKLWAKVKSTVKQLKRAYENRAVIISNTALGLVVSKMTMGRATGTQLLDCNAIIFIIFKECLRIVMSRAGLQTGRSRLSCAQLCASRHCQVAANMLGNAGPELLASVRQLFGSDDPDIAPTWTMTDAKLRTFKKNWRLVKRNYATKSFYDLHSALEALKWYMVHVRSLCMAAGRCPSTMMANTDQSHSFAWDLKAPSFVPHDFGRTGGVRDWATLSGP